MRSEPGLKSKNRPKRAPLSGAILATRLGSAQARESTVRAAKAGNAWYRNHLAGALIGQDSANTMGGTVSGRMMMDGGNESERPPLKATKDRRRERLKLALRENLKRRKSQARERSDFTPASSASDEVSRDIGEESPDK